MSPVIHGDCLELLAMLDPEILDVSDPPEYIGAQPARLNVTASLAQQLGEEKPPEDGRD